MKRKKLKCPKCKGDKFEILSDSSVQCKNEHYEYWRGIRLKSWCSWKGKVIFSEKHGAELSGDML